MIDPDGMRAVWNGKYGDDSGYNDDVTGEDKSWDDVQGEYGMGDKGKQTEAERYEEIITIKGQKYHKNTGNIFAAIGNKINSLFGGSSTRFVEHESYDPIEERDNREFAINSMGGVGGILLGKGAGLLFRGIGSKAVAEIGTKLEYVFGKATGSAHNIERSTGMLRQLESVGIFDNPAGRSVLKNNLERVFSETGGVLQPNGRYLRESLLMGPNGGLKVESVWDANKLITVKLSGGK